MTVVTRKVLLHKKPSAVQEVERMLRRTRVRWRVTCRARVSGRGPKTARIEPSITRCSALDAASGRHAFRRSTPPAARASSALNSVSCTIHSSGLQTGPSGAAIPASDLFDALAPSLVNTSVLLNEINTRIRKLVDGTEEGRLRCDLCGLVFLIGKLPREALVDAGVRANPVTLADLLVADVTADSGPFRKRVADTLDTLARRRGGDARG